MIFKDRIKIISGATIDGVNPLPKFRNRKPSNPVTDEKFPDNLKKGLGNHTKILPYLDQDRYTRNHIPLELKCVTLENEYLKAEFLTQYGGRLYSLYSKELKTDLVMRNPVIQPCNLAIRNAWLSGGIEWNIGNIGHCATTCDNVFAAKLKDGEGNDFLRIYEYERLKGIFWQVDFHLPEGSHHLLTHVRMVNPYKKDTTTYWWSNIAVTDEGKTRVLASGDNVISFVDGKMRYEKLPVISPFPEKDITYASNATRSFDFFIQPEKLTTCEWEAAAFEDGKVFYERSTPPLLCKKLFAWGNHRAGKHWQEYLSEKGNGYYVELQSGIAPSQLHDRILHSGEVLEWTQCFGGTEGEARRLHSEDYFASRDYLKEKIEYELSEKSIWATDEKLKKFADIPVKEGDIIQNGSGFGALEIMRMEKTGDAKAPKNLVFPKSTLGSEQAPWRYLLEKGKLPDEDTARFTKSYMVSDEWSDLITKSINEYGENWYNLMLLGIAVYEGTDRTKYAVDAYSDEDCKSRTEKAEKLWKKSIELNPSYIAYRNLAVLEEQRGNLEKADEYYKEALKQKGAFDDFALAEEYTKILNKLKKYREEFDFYVSLPDNCKASDRVKINTAIAAVKLDELEYLEIFFKESHYAIREGESPLTDVWFEYCARKMAKEQGIKELTQEKLNELIDFAWDNCPPDEDIDFRMSVDKNKRYRIG